MKFKINRFMAVIMAAIFVLSAYVNVSAELSNEQINKDYRLLYLYDRDGEKIEKPTAAFLAKRMYDGEVLDVVESYADYDCTTEFPSLICYVGDKVSFSDLSYDKNGFELSGWDWQYYGSLGNNDNRYNYDVVEGYSVDCNTPGETIFYLCVKSNAKVKSGCCDPWSDNGNHQTVGKNRWFPKGMYWYFTAIRVIVRPKNNAIVDLRYWDTAQNKVISTDSINAGEVYDDIQRDISVSLNAPDGYEITSWNVQLDDGAIQYTGNGETVDIALNMYLSHKFLNVECRKKDNEDNGHNHGHSSNRVVDVTYIDEETERVLKNERESVFPIELKAPSGYAVSGWVLKNENKAVESTGFDNPVPIEFKSNETIKYLIVNCLNLDSDKGNNPNPTPTVTIKPSGVCNGVIEWTETDSHSVCVGTNSRTGKKIYRTCTHTFKYRTTLTANAVIEPSTFKSGYGFDVKVNYSISTVIVSNSGGCTSWGSSRNPSATVSAPTKATVYLPWTVTNNFGTQGDSVSMEKSGNSFILPKSRISSIGARKIYTPVELAGTEEAPKTHSFEIYINGGGVNRTEFCKKLTGSITINGDMYSDDFSGAD